LPSAWKAAECYKQPPLRYALFGVELQQPRGSFAAWRERFNHETAQGKMIAPSVTPRIEQYNHPARFRVPRSSVTSLPDVAPEARIGQVLALGESTMLPADDVVYLMGKVRVVVVQ